MQTLQAAMISAGLITSSQLHEIADRKNREEKVADVKLDRIFRRELDNEFRRTPDPLFFQTQTTKAGNKRKTWNY